MFKRSNYEKTIINYVATEMQKTRLKSNLLKKLNN